MAAATLPKFMVLRSKFTGKCLCYIPPESNPKKHTDDFVAFRGNDPTSPFAKFEVELAKENPALINLRCCYNNRYLQVASAGTGPNLVTATAEKPDENSTSSGCTLFQVVYLPAAPALRLRHVQLKRYATCGSVEDRLHLHSVEEATGAAGEDVFSVIRLDSLVALPEYVAFGDGNGMYLALEDSYDRPYLRFKATEAGDPKALHQTFVNPDGTFRIRSCYGDDNTRSNKFWNLSEFMILANGRSIGEDPLPWTTRFRVIKVDNKTVSLQSMTELGPFCARGVNITGGIRKQSVPDCLTPRYSSGITTSAKLQVTELNLSRKIYNMEFAGGGRNARVYNETPVLMAAAAVVNRTDRDAVETVRVLFKEEYSWGWKAGVTMKLGGSYTTSVDFKVPFMFFRVAPKIRYSVEVGNTTELGKVETKEEWVERTYTVPVKAKTMKTVKCLAVKAKCDAPYSYIQEDTLHTGEVRRIKMHDGLFTGVNTLKYKFEVGPAVPAS